MTNQEKYEDAVLNLRAFTCDEEWDNEFMNSIKELAIGMIPKISVLSDERVNNLITHVNNIAIMSMWAHDPEHYGTAMEQIKMDATWLKVYDNTMNQLIKEFKIPVSC